MFGVREAWSDSGLIAGLGAGEVRSSRGDSRSGRKAARRSRAMVSPCVTDGSVPGNGLWVSRALFDHSVRNCSTSTRDTTTGAAKRQTIGAAVHCALKVERSELPLAVGEFGQRATIVSTELEVTSICKIRANDGAHNPRRSRTGSMVLASPTRCSIYTLLRKYWPMQSLFRQVRPATMDCQPTS